jgi:choline dehydrogenase-like flavoprotein
MGRLQNVSSVIFLFDHSSDLSIPLATINMFVDTPGDFASKTFDFLIIGGGTAGLALAARLSEDHKLTVGVLEAGQDRIIDPNILVPGRRLNNSPHGVRLMTLSVAFNLEGHPDYDWQFPRRRWVIRVETADFDD